MTPPKEESDQLPEEQPSGAGADDDTPGSAREEANENPGGADRDSDDKPGQATGNPKNAG
jgi:hypothetical protein